MTAAQPLAYTDGGSRAGRGGAAAVVVLDGAEVWRGAETHLGDHVTNQRMELEAAILGVTKAMELVPSARSIVLCSDSAYVINCLAQHWWVRWLTVKPHWTNAAGQPVANQDLWRRLLSLNAGCATRLVSMRRRPPTYGLAAECAALISAGATGGVEVVPRKVAGHSGDVFNEIADGLATQARLRGMEGNEGQV